MVKGVKHIGLAVKSIDKYKKLLNSIFGAEEVAERLSYEGTGQTSALIAMGGAYFELMEPVGDTGIVPKYLSKFGEGLHHLALRCGNTNEMLDRFEMEGMGTLGHPRGKPTIFSLPKQTFGILYEISELPDQPDDDVPGHRIESTKNSCITGIKYFAVAVSDLDKAFIRLSSIFEARRTGPRTEDSRYICERIMLGESCFKLIQPKKTESGFKEGFRWITVKTDDLEALKDRFNCLGYRLENCNGRLFTRPAETGGIRFEIMDKTDM